MNTDRDTVRSMIRSRRSTLPRLRRPEWVATEIDAFVARLGGSGRVLEIARGGGRDALELEKRGTSVRRTDLLDPLTEDLTDPQRAGTPYDGIWACACLIHVAREDLGTVLGRLAEVTRTGGRLHASVSEGDGEDVSTHAVSLQRLGATSRRTGASLPCGRHSQTPAGSSARYVGASESPMIGG
jgi:hypothetical protein